MIKRKRSLALSLVFVLLVSMFSGTSFAATNRHVDWSGSFTSAGNNTVTTVALPVEAGRVEEAWTAEVGNGAIAIVDDYVYTFDGTNISGGTDNSGTLYKINKNTGNIEGRLTLDASTGYYYSYTIYGGDHLYVGTKTKIMAIDIDSFSLKWSVVSNDKNYPILQYVNGCVITNGLVLNGETGETVATLAGGSYDWSNGVERNGKFYLTGPDGVIRAFDTTDWSEKYTLTYDSGDTGKTGSGVAFSGTKLYWGVKDGNKLYSVELNMDGSFKRDSLKSNDCGISTFCTPVISDGRVYLAGAKNGSGVVGVFNANDLSCAYVASVPSQKIQSTPIVRYVNNDGPSLQNVDNTVVPMAAQDGNYVIVQDYGDNFDSKIYVLHDTKDAVSGTFNQLIAPVPSNSAYEQLAFDKDGALYAVNDSGFLHKYVVAAVKAPVITKDLSAEEINYKPGDAVKALSITATSPDGGKISYQWQSKIGEGDWTNIRNATNSSYKPDVSEEGTISYRCVVTNTIDGETAQAESATATVTVSLVTDTPTIYVGEVTTSENEANVAIYMSGNPGIVAAKLSVDYDSDNLELVGVTNGGILQGFLHGDQLSENPFVLLWEDSLANENHTGDGTLATLTFRAKGDAVRGKEAAITVSYEPNDIYDKALNNVTFTTEAGYVIFEHQAEDPAFYLDKVETKAGETASVGVYVKENPGIVAAKLSVDYDSDKLTLISVEDTELLKGFVPVDNLTKDPFVLLWEDSLAESDNTANGKIATLTFRVADDCSAGDVADIRILLNEDDVYNHAMTNVAFTTEAGSVTVKADEGQGGGSGGDAEETTITVSFQLKTYETTWIQKHNITLEEGATVEDAFHQVLDSRAGFSYEEEPNYVVSITYNGKTLAAQGEGPNSGWKYMVNGVAPSVGMKHKTLQDGDELVWYYVVDYTQDTGRDEGSFGGGSVAPEEEVEEPSASVTPEASVNSKGEASVEIKKDELDSAVEEATKGNTAGEVVIAPEIKGDASKVTVELPKESMDKLAAGSADLTVKTDIAEVTLPAETLKDLPAEGKSVSVAVEKNEEKIKVEVAVDNKAVESFGAGVAVTIPAKEAPATTVMVIVDADGNETIVKKSAVEDGEISALLDGSCTVVLKDNKKEFSDTEGHWGKAAAEFASSRELFNGVGNGKFGMNTTMNRAMMATVFYNLENKPDHHGDHDFHDVHEGRYYEVPVAWAADHGVLSGYTDGSFRPDAPVTREQLAVMLWNYSGKPTAAKVLDFSDASSISSYAQEALQWAVEHGVMSGRTDGKLDPKGNATRAEVAQMFKNYIEKVVL